MAIVLSIGHILLVFESVWEREREREGYDAMWALLGEGDSMVFS